MASSLRGKHVIVTGASSGIGRATAVEMARRGARVTIAARRTEQLHEAADECRDAGAECTVAIADISRPEDCRRLIEQAGQVDVLVNNAGFAVFGPIAITDPAAMRDMIHTNYLGAVWCTQAVLPQMLERKSGTIVNVASIAGIMGYAGMGGYCASKFALVGFTEALRDEVIGSGVRVSLVCPGTTESDFFVRAERMRMPAASRLIKGIAPARVARVICDAAEHGGYRRILPFAAAVYMRFKEISPRLAHLLMRRVSAFLE